MMQDSFGARATLRVDAREYEIWRLDALEAEAPGVARLPYSLRILLENLLRGEDGLSVGPEQIRRLARWDPAEPPVGEIAFTPARTLLQDFTGVPAIVDLAAMRAAMATLGGDPARINPLQPAELVIDHSVQVDAFGSDQAIAINRDRDYERNGERYAFLRWGQHAFHNLKVVPPNTGICHQVNLEYLSRVVFSTDEDPRAPRDQIPRAYPDTLVGTDSHTPMVNGLGVLGWGVGGIEAEAAMLGQSIAMLIPAVVGVRLDGELREGATATDLVLTVAELLRKQGVVGKFVEFYGPGIAALPIPDRATIGNMSPEYGSTCSIFPVDDETLRYLRFTGRPPERVALVEAYMKEQGLFHTADSPEPVYTEHLRLDLGSVEPSIAGPRRPQDRIPLSRASTAFQEALPSLMPTPPGSRAADGGSGTESSGNGIGNGLSHGSIVIAAITSCTNTSNPSVMLAAGILARKAAERGLRPRPWVKTSLAPGSQVVTRYYEAAGLTPYLDALGFDLVGYGCTTCIGNSGPLLPEVSTAIAEGGLVACAVLSGNRNFEGRIHPEVRANYLASPPLVVAYALAGRMDVDLYNDPLGTGSDGQPVFLRDIWPTRQEVQETVASAVQSEMFRRIYSDVYTGDEVWRALPVPEGDLYVWDPASTYVKNPPYFEGMTPEPPPVAELSGLRVLALLGDSITTDHISPAGAILRDSPAGRYLLERGVEQRDFNSYGSRRGNHEVMVRGTFANPRIRNQLAPGTEGGLTTHLPTGEVLTIYDAAMRYLHDGTPLMVIAGKEYGSGSSRDWAAKGPFLLGIRAVLAESFERIHRSNLVGMGILPLQFEEGASATTLGLTGRESFEIEGLRDRIAEGLAQGRGVRVLAHREDGEPIAFDATIRIDTPQEVLYYRHGGILQYVLRELLSGRKEAQAISMGPASVAQCNSDRPCDAVVDESSEQSFPASDAPAY
jgi:aconitate hydratase